MPAYRIFISYAHADRAIVERLVTILRAAGTAPMWDRQLLPGLGFSRQIQDFIVNTHIFLPVMTAESATRPWLHQEIGFAAALGKIIVPVILFGEPSGIISELQAVRLRPDLSDAPEQLSAAFFQRLMEAERGRIATYECTRDNTQRADLLARYADSVSALGEYAEVRQIISLSSFHLPERGSGDPIWKRYFHAGPDDPSLFEGLRREREALMRHAVARGCSLILDPIERLNHVYEKHGPDAVRARVEGLLSFLRSPSVSKVMVAIGDDPARDRSVTLVGDWFLSEAVSSGAKRVLREALFTRDALLIRREMDDFDGRLNQLLNLRKWTRDSSREQAIAYFSGFLERG